MRTGRPILLVARGLDPAEAACGAVYAHGLAADLLAAAKTGDHALTASMLYDALLPVLAGEVSARAAAGATERDAAE